jgi:single-strand DNA-binding protein
VEGINRVVITGELAGDSTFGHAAGGATVATFTLAFPCDPGKQGNESRKKGFVDIIFFGVEASRWAALLKKGRKVVIEGKLQQRNWKTLEGIKGSKTEIVAQRIECCNSSEGKRELHSIK